MSLIHCTTLLVLLSFCIKAPAQFSPSSLPPCSFFSPPHSSPHFTFPVYDNANLTVFNQSSLPSSTPITFNVTFSLDEFEHVDLAFILVRSPPQQLDPPAPPSIQSIQIDFIPGAQCFSHKCLNVCNSLPLQIPTNTCSFKPDPNDSDKTQVNLSLAYEVDAAALQVQVNYTGRYEINQTFTLDLHDSRGDDIITLFIGYIITIQGPTMSGAPTPTHDKSSDKSNKLKVVLWVVVGVSMMIFLMGLIILVLSITKRRGHPSLVSSRPAGRRPAGRVAPSSTTSRAPFPHHHLESKATPMIHALPLSPPYTNDFQISGTATWLKQPNAR